MTLPASLYRRQRTISHMLTNRSISTSWSDGTTRCVRVGNHLCEDIDGGSAARVGLTVRYYAIAKSHPLPALARRGDGMSAASRSISGSSISARPSASDIKSSSVKRPDGTRAKRGIGGNVHSVSHTLPRCSLMSNQ